MIRSAGVFYLSSTLDQTQLDRFQQAEPTPQGSFSLLTAREKQVLTHIADGLNSKEISERIGIGSSCVGVVMTR